MQINSTEAAGLLAFVPPMVSAAAAHHGARPRYSRRRHAWAAIAVIYAVLAVEVLARTRYVIGDSIRAVLRNGGLYSERRPAQAITLLVLITVGSVLAIHIMRKAPNRPCAIAWGSTAAAVVLFIAESVSLHAVDGILYARAGPVLLIGWLWLACGWCSATAAASQAMVAAGVEREQSR